MTETRLEAQRAPWAELWQRAQRERSLLALFDAGQRKQFALRSARFYAIGIFLGYGLLIAISGARDRRETIHALLQGALTSLSWAVAGLVALGAARSLTEPAANDALAALARQRGRDTRGLLRARTLSVGASIARWVAAPGLLLAAIGALRGARLAWALAVAPAIAAYAIVVGLLAALLALLAARLAPNRPRWMLAALLALPWLVSQAQPSFPTLPKLLSELLSGLLAAGAGLT